MKIVIDRTRVSRRRRIAGVLVFAGLLLLLSGLVNGLFFEPRPSLDYLLLVGGTILAWAGTTQMDRWVTPPRPERALPEALGDAGPPWALYYMALPAETVLVSPGGLFVVDDFKHDGLIRIQGARWRDRRSLLRRLTSLGRRAVRDPSRLLDLQAEALREALVARDEAWASLPIDPLVVFTHPAAELEREDPSLPVVRADELRTWLRTEGRRKALPPRVQRDLARALDALAEERIAGKAASGDEAEDEAGDEGAGSGAAS